MRALVRDHWDEGTAQRAVPSTVPGGATLLLGPAAWVLIDDGEAARFGPALAWAVTRSVSTLHVLVDGSPTAPGIVARRAAAFARPDLAVWAVSGRSLAPAAAASVVPDPGAPPPAEVVSLLIDAGLEVVWEHGVLRGEVLGLEVARTVGDHLEVGVGRHDRWARAELRPGQPVGRALGEAADAVRRLRRVGAPTHPANTLARSRWLRSVLVTEPALVGLASLSPVAPPLPWFDLPESAAAPAVGLTGAGREVVAVCSVGLDLDLVATAVDCRALHGPASDLWVVVPEGDDIAVNRALASATEPPTTVVTVGRDWAERL